MCVGFSFCSQKYFLRLGKMLPPAHLLSCPALQVGWGVYGRPSVPLRWRGWSGCGRTRFSGSFRAGSWRRRSGFGPTPTSSPSSNSSTPTSHSAARLHEKELHPGRAQLPDYTKARLKVWPHVLRIDRSHLNTAEQQVRLQTKATSLMTITCFVFGSATPCTADF